MCTTGNWVWKSGKEMGLKRYSVRERRYTIKERALKRRSFLSENNQSDSDNALPGLKVERYQIKTARWFPRGSPAL